MTSHGEPPLKKLRPNAKSASNALAGSSCKPGYFTEFSKQTTIAVVVTPLRHRQANIITRNLSNAGARIIQSDIGDISTHEESENSELLVITDNLSKAEDRIKSAKYNFQRVRYVSTKWASKVLLAETVLPIEPYLLDNSDSPSKRRKSVTVSSSSFSPFKKAQTSFLPVWCTRGRTESRRKQLLSLLPPYLCQRCTISQSIYPCPNQDLCSILESLAEKRILEQAGGDPFSADIRARAYRLASSALKCVPFKLLTKHDADTLHTFGPRVLAIANEYLTTGQVSEARQLETDARLRNLKQLTSVYDVGAKTARDLYDSCNVKSIGELRRQVCKEPGQFSEAIGKYLWHYDSLRRVDLATARMFTRTVQDLVNSAPNALHLRITLCGGFRRGEPTGHDVDLVYCRTPPYDNDTRSIMKDVISHLSSANLLPSTLSLATNQRGGRERRYGGEATRTIYPYAHDIAHGIAKFKNKTFRVDIVGIRVAQEFPFATLAWSGSTLFQRSLRQYCEVQNMIFNQHGLFDRTSGVRIGLSPMPRCEMDIFNALNLRYRAPFERSC